MFPTRSPGRSDSFEKTSESSVTSPLKSPPTLQKKRSPEQWKEKFRRFAREVVDINDPAYKDAMKARARQGRLSPLEHAKLIDAAYHFDIDEKPVPPVVAIQIQQVFADGEQATKNIVVGVEPVK